MTFPQKVTGIALTVLSIAVLGQAAEKRIPKSSLPPVVAKTAGEQSRGATVQGYTQDMENGQMEYEVELTVNGLSKDVSIGADGRVLEVEEQVEIGALSAGVQAALKQKAGSGDITKSESISKHGPIVA
mgnify:CR=1 FL=1